MLWNLMAVAVAGFVLGLLFRWGAVLAAMILVAGASIGICVGTGRPATETILLTFELVVILQCTYLAGVGLQVWWRRMKRR